MASRHVSGGSSAEEIEAILEGMGFARREARGSTRSGWEKDGRVAYVGDLGLEEPWGYLVVEDGADGLEGEVSVASMKQPEPTDFLGVLDAVMFFRETAEEIGLEDDGVVYVVDVPDEELLTQVRLVGASATGDEDEDAVEVLERAARSGSPALQAAAIEAIGWSTWERLGGALEEVAASDDAPEEHRARAREVLAERRASGWGIWVGEAG